MLILRFTLYNLSTFHAHLIYLAYCLTVLTCILMRPTVFCWKPEDITLSIADTRHSQCAHACASHH